MRRSHWLHLALALAMAPWPQMRLDQRNTARSDVREVVSASAVPWEVRTGGNVFNTPVVDRAGTAYVGSADGKVYAIGAGGAVRWTYATGGPVTAPGLLVGKDLVVGARETLLRLRTKPNLKPRKRVVWRFKSPLRAGGGQRVNRWEGGLSRHPDGDILAPNTGGGAHKLSASKRLVYARRARDAVRTAPATAADGTTYWGSLDRTIFALNDAGGRKWSTSTLGFVTGSPAVGPDGTVYGTSFDGRVYALDPKDGVPRWAFQTRDHIVGGPAVSSTGGVVVGSTDGGVYGLSPGGRLAWRYDTGDPVRSSPVIGVTASGQEVAYVGSSDGKLYAIDVATGDRRWSFDTTPVDDAAAAARNDLNGSPALTRGRVIIGGEHGSVFGVPYDYCLRLADGRCETSPEDDLPAGSGARVLPVSSAGSTLDGVQTVSSATALTGRLLVRPAGGGGTLDATVSGAPRITTTFPATTAVSGDGRFLHVVPDEILAPDTTYEIRAAGSYAVDGATEPSGTYDDVLRVRTEPDGAGPALEVGAENATGFVFERLALPLPALLSSVGQISLDSRKLIAGVVRAGQPDAGGQRDVLLWVIGATRGAGGQVRPDPKAGVAFPLAGRMRGDQFLLRRDGVSFRASFGDVPVRRLELRGGLDAAGSPNVSAYAEVDCGAVPTYGPLLRLSATTCNDEGVLVAAGTFTASPFTGVTRPPGVDVQSVDLVRPTASTAGRVTAVLTGSLRADRHVASVLLAGPDGAPIKGIDYVAGTTTEVVRGDIRRVTVDIPAGTELPGNVLGAVMTDAFRLAVRAL